MKLQFLSRVNELAHQRQTIKQTLEAIDGYIEKVTVIVKINNLNHTLEFGDNVFTNFELEEKLKAEVKRIEAELLNLGVSVY